MEYFILFESIGRRRGEGEGVMVRQGRNDAKMAQIEKFFFIFLLLNYNPSRIQTRRNKNQKQFKSKQYLNIK